MAKAIKRKTPSDVVRHCNTCLKLFKRYAVFLDEYQRKRQVADEEVTSQIQALLKRLCRTSRILVNTGLSWDLSAQLSGQPGLEGRMPWGYALSKFNDSEAELIQPFIQQSSSGLPDLAPKLLAEDCMLELDSLLAIAHKMHEEQTPKPLNERDVHILQIIPLGSQNAITGSEIIKRLWSEKGFRLTQNTLTTHVIPRLKTHGVRTLKPDGYYRTGDVPHLEERGNGAAYTPVDPV